MTVDDVELDAWLSHTVIPDFGTTVGYDDAAVAFFRALYAERGALTGELLWTAAALHQSGLARQAVEKVAGDVAATLPEQQAQIEAVVEGFVVRIEVNGRRSGHDGGRMLSFDVSDALVEVATTVQDLVTELWWTVWPECPEHERGLLPEAGSPPVWACRSGPHVVAPIGGLQAPKPHPA